MLNLAFIGCGVIAQFHLRGMARLKIARAALVCDLRPDVAQKTAVEFSVPRWTSSVDEVLADPSIDGVVLSLPANIRTEIAIKAFKAGKHVLTEKPVAMNAKEVQSMMAVQNDLIGAVCSCRYRDLESAKVAKAFLKTGALGAIRTISCRGIYPAGKPPVNPPAWRLRKDLNGGGIFLNWGSYDLDYLLGFFDFKLTPQFALGRTWTVGEPFKAYAAPNSDGETHVNALVTFAEGCVLDYERAEFSTIPSDHRWQIVGERGTLSLQMLKVAKANVVFTEAVEGVGAVTRVLWEGDETVKELDCFEHYTPVWDFAGAIAEKRKPLTSLEDSLLMTRISDAVYASSASGKPVAF